MSKKKKDEKTEDDNVTVVHKKNKSQDTKEGQQEQEIKEEESIAEEGKKEEALLPEEQLKKELNAEKDKFLRLFAEFENYKKRVSRERIALFKTAGQEIMLALLPVLDDFDRGMALISTSEDKEMLKGVELIQHKFTEILKSKGLMEVEVAKGDDFDAEIHDAITQIPAPEEGLKGKIVDVTEKGYKLGDKIIRYPKVVVGQ